MLARSAVVTLTGFAITGALAGCSGSSRHGSLSGREYSVAVAVSKQEAKKVDGSVSRAWASPSTGTLTDSNTGHTCTSGRLLHITIVGTFDHIAVSLPVGTDPGPVVAVNITADPKSGYACLIGVDTVMPSPESAATVLDLS